MKHAANRRSRTVAKTCSAYFGLLFNILILAAGAGAAHAQVRRPVPRIALPATWISISGGLFNANGVSDGRTSSTWDFGQASNLQVRAAVERTLQGQTSLGLVGTYLHAPFTYIGLDGDDSCARCAAHLDLLSLGASFHVGGGQGLHQVIEGSAGVAQYRNLTRDSDDSPLNPVGGNFDPYFSFGYGFGYGFSNRMQASVVQDLGIVLHERNGLSSESSNTLRQRSLRLNFRYGVGNRARTR